LATILLCLDNDGQVITPECKTVEAAIARRPRLIWIDVQRSERAAIHSLQQLLDLHELSVEDAIKGNQRPKIDTYENDTFFFTFYVINGLNGSSDLQELSLFVGDGFIVTVHDGDMPILTTIANRWNSVSKMTVKKSKGMLLYAIIDAIVDGYFPVLDALSEKLEDLEERAFDMHDQDARANVFSLRRDISKLRRIVSSERDVVNTLLRHDLPIFSHEVSVYLADVYDHLLRALDWLDASREELASLLDLQSTIVANRLNQIMKTLTASSIVLMSASLVAGIYGMNFTHMPELGWKYGYPYALLVMVLIMGIVLVFFRRRNWF
jgi:magnesium transporter